MLINTAVSRVYGGVWRHIVVMAERLYEAVDHPACKFVLLWEMEVLLCAHKSLPQDPT